MIVCISGARDDPSFKALIRKLLLEKKPTQVLVGCARGVDQSAREVCKTIQQPFRVFYAEWKKYGLRAGFLRNSKMLACSPDEVWTFHRDIEQSKGTKMTAKLAEERGIHVEYFNASHVFALDKADIDK